MARLKRAAKKTPLCVSAATHRNVDEVLRALVAAIGAQTKADAPVKEAATWQP